MNLVDYPSNQDSDQRQTNSSRQSSNFNSLSQSHTISTFTKIPPQSTDLNLSTSSPNFEIFNSTSERRSPRATTPKSYSRRIQPGMNLTKPLPSPSLSTEELAYFCNRNSPSRFRNTKRNSPRPISPLHLPNHETLLLRTSVVQFFREVIVMNQCKMQRYLQIMTRYLKIYHVSLKLFFYFENNIFISP
jgi:hypothetical protein